MKKAIFSAMAVLGAILLGACSSSPSVSKSDYVSVPHLHPDPSSASYQDGYAEGQNLVNDGLVSAQGDQSSDIMQTPVFVCAQHEGDKPNSDNGYQWLAGCATAVRAFGNPGSGSSSNTTTTTTPPTTTTTTTTVPLTSAQQAFANAVINQLPLVVISTQPPLTQSAIVKLGSEICSAFSIGVPNYVSSGGGPSQGAASFVYQEMLPELANGAIPGPNGVIGVPSLHGAANGSLMNLAIQDLCPQYASGIPAG
jgi:hypothetical protein